MAVCEASQPAERVSSAAVSVSRARPSLLHVALPEAPSNGFSLSLHRVAVHAVRGAGR